MLDYTMLHPLSLLCDRQIEHFLTRLMWSIFNKIQRNYLSSHVSGIMVQWYTMYEWDVWNGRGHIGKRHVRKLNLFGLASLKPCFTETIWSDTIRTVYLTGWQSVEPTWNGGGKSGCFEKRNQYRRYTQRHVIIAADIWTLWSKEIRLKIKIVLLRIIALILHFSKFGNIINYTLVWPSSTLLSNTMLHQVEVMF
jgi:hypothetical protein